MGKTAELTDKQKKFVDYYIQTGNATQSAIMAGYSEASAHSIGDENLRKPAVKKLLQERTQKETNNRIATAEEILEYLSSVVRGQITEENFTTVGVGEGKSVIEKVKTQVKPKDRNKAAEMLAKRYGILTEAININATLGVQIIDDIGDKNESD